ncbi:MAG: AbrB/MazE/SpoVT family DNA-binding domain-containing protein [Chloroflexota bacterium]|nr:AbrB/MazE/SpoVT family DNA-binding domain-containing protein [Chloroflexota bacterium]
MGLIVGVVRSGVDTDRYAVTLGDRGRLVLPAPLRRQLEFHPGDRLILSIEPEGTLRMISARAQARRLRGVFSGLAPGRSLVDELIAERRGDARREEE